jgi:hypothetical protein
MIYLDRRQSLFKERRIKLKSNTQTFVRGEGPQQMLRTHRSLQPYCAALWWRLLAFSVFPCNGAQKEPNYKEKPTFVRSTSFFHLLTRSVDVVCFRLITFRQTPQWSLSSGRGIGPSRRPVTYNTNTQNRKTSMSPVGFEITIPANARPQTDALDRAATGIGKSKY